jgi:hypothetical protein
VIFSSHSRRATLCRHVTKIPSPQLLLFPGLTNGDACNSFRIRSYANCRVTSFKPNIFLPPIPAHTLAFPFLSSIFRTFFQVPYPVSPLLATLTKSAGVCTNNSHSGTRPVGSPTHPQPTWVERPLALFRSVHPAFSVISALNPSLSFQLSIEDPGPCRDCRLSTSSRPFFRESQVTDCESQFFTSSILCVAI